MSAVAWFRARAADPSLESQHSAHLEKDSAQAQAGQDGTRPANWRRRGTETTVNTYRYLDLVPKGRDEDALPFTMSWLRHHDRYADGYLADADRPYWPADIVPAS